MRNQRLRIRASTLMKVARGNLRALPANRKHRKAAVAFLKRVRAMQRARDLHGNYSGDGAAIPCRVIRRSGRRLKGTLCWTKQALAGARLALRVRHNDFYSPAAFSDGKEDAILVLG